MQANPITGSHPLIAGKKVTRDFLLRGLPVLLLVVWLAFIAVLVWHHVCKSTQVPIYDALSYLEKAKSFWHNVSLGWPENPFNLVQVVRPPGTVLLSYPFGFSDDYRGFLFRTVIVPFVIWVFAILVAAWPTQNKSWKRSYWPRVLAVFLLGPMPFFFQFEYPAPYAYWGMVDGFLASLAALAVAAAIRGLVRRSHAWTVTSAFIAVFCLLVKPSGSLIILLVILFWSAGGIVSFLRTKPGDRMPFARFWLFGTILFVVPGVVVSWMCLNSQYLSPEVIAFYRQSMVILQSDFGHMVSFPVFLSLLYSLFGPQFMLILLLGGIFFYQRTDKERFEPPTWLFMVASTLFCLTGGWFWIFASGVSQVRYFYPFALMSLIPVVFVVFRKLNSGGILLSKVLSRGTGIVCIVPAINLLLLLLVPGPNGHWQKFSGVSMKASSEHPGIMIAGELMNELAVAGKRAVVYVTKMTNESSSFICYGMYQSIIRPKSVYYTTVSAIDWHRSSTYRISEITDADYIFFTPVLNSKPAKASANIAINSLEEEERMIDAFLSALKPGDGLTTLFEHRNFRLSKVSNRSRLQKVFCSFVNSNSWRPVFLEANRDLPSSCSDRDSGR